MSDVTVKGLKETTARIKRLEKGIKDIPLNHAAGYIAEVWDDNYNGEGYAFGNWAGLGDATQRVREFRGYGKEHPILKQSGDLYKVAVLMPLKMSKRGGTTASGKLVAGSIYEKNNRMDMYIQGEKVSNQFGESGEWDEFDVLYKPGQTEWSMPPRPFWFVNQVVIAAAAKGAQEGIDDMLRKVW